jgi:hypothetical protein
MQMTITHPLFDEVIAWVKQLGPNALTDARKEYSKQQGHTVTHGEALPYLIASRGTERIKEVWRQWMSMSGEQIFNGRSRD